MSWVAIALFSNSEKAKPLQQRLQVNGIAADLHGESPLAMMWFVSKREAGVRLMVPADQFERAEQRLQESDRQGALRDAIRCPECMSLRVLYPQYALNSLLTNLLLGLASVVGLVERDVYCQDCHYTWPKQGTRPRRNRPHLAPYYFIEGVKQTTLSPPSPAAPSRPLPEAGPDQKKAA